MNQSFHIPGMPKTSEPVELVNIVSTLHHPNVVKSGLTTTNDGNWALLLVVKKNTTVPIKEIEEKYHNFPIIYHEESGRTPIARPAYPSLGE